MLEAVNFLAHNFVAGCFAALRQLIYCIQRSVSKTVLLSLVTSLVLSSLDYGSATLAGIPKYLLDRLQSVLNAAARVIAVLTCITTCLHCFRNYTGWLFLNASNTDWPYLCFVVGTTWHLSTWRETSSGPLTQLDSLQRLRSSSSQRLVVPRTRLSTVGDRAFGVAAARIWNDLPVTVTSAATGNRLKHLKTYFLIVLICHRNF